jgi:MSHA biogenesis protein MshG
MPTFSYTGRDPQGQRVRGSLDALSAQAVASSLGGQGITPLTIQAAATAPGLGLGLEQAWAWLQDRLQPGISQQELQLFSRQMHTLLRAGVPILRALEGLRQSATHPAFALVLADVLEQLQAGRELSSCFAKHPKVFSYFFCSMIQVGEVTGQLDEMFLRLSQHLEFERDLAERVRVALRYPSFVVLAMAGALVGINLLVIPAFSKVFASFHAELPMLTRVLIGFSDFMLHDWWLLGGAAAGGWMAFKAWVSRPTGRFRWDRLKMRLPIAGTLVTKATLSRFCSSFALSLRSGVPITTGLATVALAVDNAYMRRIIEQMKEGIERGDSVLRNAVDAKVFTPVVLQMISVGEETGDLDGMLQEIAAVYQREVDSQLKNLSAQIEPILIVAMGALVMLLALGVFLPMWDLGSVTQGRK